MKRPQLETDLDRLVKGERKQWEQFVTEVSPPVYSVIRKTLAAAGRDHSEACDLMQELFERLCRNNFRVLRAYRPELSSITTWLCLLARNITIDYLRRRRPVQCSLDEITGLQTRQSLPVSEKPHIPLDILPPRQRLIMKLLYEKEMDVKEVADFTGVSEQTVRSMRHKAIKRLRIQIKK